jgi:hypothetical protein
MRRTRRSPAAGLLLVLTAAAGCGGGGTVPFRGTVKLDGRPLEHATVYFIAQEPGGRDALGSTDAEGEFRLSTFKPGDGAFPGRYKVVVQLAAPVDTGVVAATPAEAFQASGGGGKPGRPAVTLPPRYSRAEETVLVEDVPAEGSVVFELQSE